MDKNFETSQKGDNVPPSSPLFKVEGPENIAGSTFGGRRGEVVFVSDQSYLYNSLSQ